MHPEQMHLTRFNVLPGVCEHYRCYQRCRFVCVVNKHPKRYKSRAVFSAFLVSEHAQFNPFVSSPGLEWRFYEFETQPQHFVLTREFLAQEHPRQNATFAKLSVREDARREDARREDARREERVFI